MNKKNMPIVSVIVPTRNRPHYLVTAIESIFNQTYKNFEVIIVNDSGEDISDVIAPFKDMGNVIYITLNKRKGPAGARNCGLQKAKGKYIAYLDDDDIYYPKHLETLVEFVETGAYKFAYSDSYQAFQEWDGSSYVTKEKKLAYGGDFDKQRFLIKDYIPILTVVHRKDCIEEVGMFDEGLGVHEDWDLWIRMSQKFDFHHIRAVTAEFRTRERSDSITSNNFPEFLRVMKKIHSRYSHYVTVPKIIKAQKMIVNLNEAKIEQQEKVSIYPINLSAASNNVIDSKVSIIIPVKNGGEGFRKLLERIQSQRRVGDVEIIVIDEDLGDNSIQTAKEFGAKVVNLSPGEYNHGNALNLAVSAAKGDYIIFTIQDAMPVSNYWLYNMICPFNEYPELAALSCKQFVKSEVDLFNLWMNALTAESTYFKSDTICILSKDSKNVNWKLFDTEIKKRLTYFNSISSCVRRKIFDGIRFSQLINNEDVDIDFGVKLLESGKSIGYLTSAGVYHWHKRGADYVFKRSYIETKVINILINDLPYFFDINDIRWECLAENITGGYNLINITVAELGDIDSNPVTAIRTFINLLQKSIDTSPHKIEKALKERKIHVNKSLDLLLGQAISDIAFMPERQYNFKQNFLIPGFMNRFGQFVEYLCSKHNTLKGREKDFVSCIYKIFAMAAGEALSAYYLEAESLNRLTPDLKRIDQLLARSVCYF